jgi:hypothetical protein
MNRGTTNPLPLLGGRGHNARMSDVPESAPSSAVRPAQFTIASLLLWTLAVAALACAWRFGGMLSGVLAGLALGWIAKPRAAGWRGIAVGASVSLVTLATLAFIFKPFSDVADRPPFWELTWDWLLAALIGSYMGACVEAKVWHTIPLERTVSQAPTKACPHCGRLNSIGAPICPRCEQRLA